MKEDREIFHQLLDEIMDAGKTSAHTELFIQEGGQEKSVVYTLRIEELSKSVHKI